MDVTRRQAVLAGAGVLLVGVAGAEGRFALGDTFESHVAETLGLPVPVTKDMLGALRAELDAYDIRAAAFLQATTSPGKQLLPDSVRRKAIRGFIRPLFDIQAGFVMPQVYVGLKEDGRFSPCTALAEPT
jgi:hypothetical protein